MNRPLLLLLALAAQILTAQTSTVTYFRYNNQDTVARGINNHGAIAGYYTPTGSGQPRGFLRNPAGVIESILAPNATDTRLNGINDLGEIVGSTNDNTKAIIRRANGEFVEIIVPTATAAAANAINNSGYVVGSFQNASTSRRAYFRNLAGNIIVLGEIIPGEVEAVSIANNTDRIALSQLQSTFYRTHLSTPTGSFDPLFLLNGQTRSINAHNVILTNDGNLIRVSRPPATSPPTLDSTAFQLPNTNAVSVHAYGINDNNQIVGAYSDSTGSFTAFQIDPCSPNLSTTSRTHGSGAETGAIPLTTTDGTGFCLWIATTNVPWVSFTRSVGLGTRSVVYRLQPNTTNTERQAVIRIGANQFTITQASGDCHYTVTPSTTQPLTADGGTVTYTIATTPGCPWTVYTETTYAFVAPTSGTGNGTVTVQVSPTSPNQSIQREVPINVAGSWFTAIQQPPTCELRISRTNIDVPAQGALENLRITVRTGCIWNASSNASWITITGGTNLQSVLSTSTLTLTIAASNEASQRTGTVTINTAGPPGPSGNIITINQAPAAACAYSLNSNYANAPGEGGTSQQPFRVITGDTCPITPVIDVPWLRLVAPPSTAPRGTINYHVDRNPTRVPRRGIIRVNGLTFTVDQLGNPLLQLGFVPLAPCRFVDTRTQPFPFSWTALQPGEPRGVFVGPTCGVPETARAVVVKVTAIPVGPLAFLSVSYSSQSPDLTRSSTLNSWDGRTVSNLAVIPGRGVSFYASDATHVIAETVGYFADSTWDSLVLYPVTPCRLLDTRTSGNTPIPANSTRTLQATGNCGIPANAAALSLNVTAIPRNTTLGSLTVFPTGQFRPEPSPLNAAPGRIVANAALLATGAGGSINIHASHEADVIVDVNGYFSTPSDSGLYFNALQPCRIADTRLGSNEPLQPGATRTFNPAATAPECNVPAEARAHLVNATVVPPGPLAFLSLFPSPNWTGSSTLNAYDGQVTANLAIVPDTGQAIGVTSSNATHLVLDTLGYFMAVPADQRRPIPLLSQTANENPTAKTEVNQ
jgi:hypothetical protein